MGDGQTVTVRGLTLTGCNALSASYEVTGAVSVTEIGNTAGHSDCRAVRLDTFRWTNDTGDARNFYLWLTDLVCDFSYRSDGSGDADHATASASKVSIADGGFFCDQTGTVTPTLGKGNLDASVSVR